MRTRRIAVCSSAFILSLTLLTIYARPASGEYVKSGPFTEANAKYQAGDFKAAVEAYEGLLKSGERTAPVYYNLANAYFRLGQKAKAVIAYERALGLAPRDPDIRWNIAVLKSVLPDRLEPKDDDVFMLWLRELTDKFTVNECAVAFTGILAFWTLCAWLGYFFPGLKTWVAAFQTAAFFCLLAVGGIFFFQWQEVRVPRIVVTDREVSARYGPSNRETKAFTLHEGAEGRVMDEANDWVNVSLVDKNSGWIPKKSCELI